MEGLAREKTMLPALSPYHTVQTSEDWQNSLQTSQGCCTSPTGRAPSSQEQCCWPVTRGPRILGESTQRWPQGSAPDERRSRLLSLDFCSTEGKGAPAILGSSFWKMFSAFPGISEKPALWQTHLQRSHLLLILCNFFFVNIGHFANEFLSVDTEVPASGATEVFSYQA